MKLCPVYQRATIMTNWKKIEERVASISSLKEELRELRRGQKPVAKKPVPFILYTRPWESIVIKVKKEK